MVGDGDFVRVCDRDFVRVCDFEHQPHPNVPLTYSRVRSARGSSNT